MLSNRQNVACSYSTVVAPLASVDICEIDTSADDADDDNNVYADSRNPTPNGNGRATVLVNNNNCNSNHNLQNQFASDKMLTSPASGVRAARPSTINLQPIRCENGEKFTNAKDITDGCFHSATDDSEYTSSGQGINIQFQDIIYRARREISWDRCKCKSHSFHL